MISLRATTNARFVRGQHSQRSGCTCGGKIDRSLELVHRESKEEEEESVGDVLGSCAALWAGSLIRLALESRGWLLRCVSEVHFYVEGVRVKHDG